MHTHVHTHTIYTYTHLQWSPILPTLRHLIRPKLTQTLEDRQVASGGGRVQRRRPAGVTGLFVDPPLTQVATQGEVALVSCVVQRRFLIVVPCLQVTALLAQVGDH